MKHDNGMMERQFMALCSFPEETQRFYTFQDNPRYCALFKAHKVTNHVHKGVLTGKLKDVFTLYIYDAESLGGSAAFKVTVDGVLGYHGTKDHVEEQKLLVAQLVHSISNQVMNRKKD